MFSLLLRWSMLSVSPRSEPLPEERSSRSRGSNRSSPTIGMVPGRRRQAALAFPAVCGGGGERGCPRG